MKNRKEELLKAFEEVDDGVKEIVVPMIDDVVFLEEQLVALRGLPFLRVHPTDPAQQKPTPAAKMYKELLQQYNNCIKILCGVLNRNGAEDESPLRAFLNGRGFDD